MRAKYLVPICIVITMIPISIYLVDQNNVSASSGNLSSKNGETIESMPEFPLDKPEPRYKPNKGLPKDQTFDIEKNLNRAFVTQKGGAIEKTELMTYADFALKQSRSPNDYPEVSPDRLIWVVQTHYPKGYEHPKVGLIQNARVTTIYDAETGEVFGTTYKGKGPSAKSLLHGSGADK